MSRRSQIFQTVVNSLVPLLASPCSVGTGWPGLCALNLPGGTINVALHVATVSPHARKPYEMRFQNPAAENRPAVSNMNGSALPILLGVSNDSFPPVYVAVDGRSRVGNTTRFSILFHVDIINQARQSGWAVYVSSTGERIHAFVPEMLPSFIEQLLAGEELPSEELSNIAVASGALGVNFGIAPEAMSVVRATKAVNTLVRRAGVGRRIREAYGNRCAMCGIGSNLLQGAHIYPVEAPGSTDEVSNGLSLCYNHHRAFDLHLIWVDPFLYRIKLHSSLIQDGYANQAARLFISSTWAQITLPGRRFDYPSSEMFARRYAYFADEYCWAS